MTPLIALVILLLDSICASGNGERLKISKDTLVQQNTAYLLTTGLARSTWRLAAEDGNVHTYTHTHFPLWNTLLVRSLVCCFYLTHS